METTKTCPACGAEYRPTALNCADCNVTLEWTRAPGPTPEPGALDTASWESLAAGGLLGLVTGDHEDIVRVYLAHLHEAGIPAALLPRTRFVGRGGTPSYSRVFGALAEGGAGFEPVGSVLDGYEYELYVRRPDYERAAALVDDLYTELHPDRPEGLYREFDASACPACGCGLGDDATECPDCGLALG
ncbi:hypothetical protein KDM41_02085 [bacterium]|nr:hypothetical protein [bacterium]